MMEEIFDDYRPGSPPRGSMLDERSSYDPPPYEYRDDPPPYGARDSMFEQSYAFCSPTGPGYRTTDAVVDLKGLNLLTLIKPRRSQFIAYSNESWKWVLERVKTYLENRGTLKGRHAFHELWVSNDERVWGDLEHTHQFLNSDQIISLVDPED